MAVALVMRMASAAETTAPELARALQAKFDGLRDFSADFTHAYEGGVLHKVVTERGHLLMKKPGKMRWDYTSPEPKLFVSDGVKMYSYIPADKQVIVTTVPSEDEATTPALFLAGKGSLTRDYTPTLVEVPTGMAAGSRGSQAGAPCPAAGLRLGDSGGRIRPAWRIRGLVSQDAQGGISSFSFANLKENVGLADKEFAFKIPRGVDVVTPYVASLKLLVQKGPI